MIQDFAATIASGTLLGLSAGFTPGPLLALVLSVSLRHGIREGVKVAVSPLLTDIPIIALTTLLLTRLDGHSAILGLVSICGAGLIALLSLECLRCKGLDVGPAPAASNALLKGLAVNALSPHPYLFWLTVGSPILLRNWNLHPTAALAFVLSFSLSLVGAKISLAAVAAGSRQRIGNSTYILIMRGLGVLLLLFATSLVIDAAQLLGG